MFATIIIVLPSEFTGGQIHLSHGGVDMVYDCSATSLNTTTVMAWYTDVTHEVKPITGGYRLALSYNLIHTTTALRPAVSSDASFVEEALRILNAWSESSASDTPEKLLYLLDHRYSLANLRGSALKGADDVKVALLQQVTQQAGFSLGMATVVYSLRGSAEEGGCGWGNRVNFGDVASRDMTIEEFVNLEGVKISDRLYIDEDTETIPADLAEVIEGGDYDDQEHEGPGYMGNVGLNLHHTPSISF